MPWMRFWLVHHPDVHRHELPNVRLCSLSDRDATDHDDHPANHYKLSDVFVPSLRS